MSDRPEGLIGILSGETRGPGASLIRGVLHPLSWLFRGLATLRSKGYDWGLLKSTKVGLPIVCIGNLTTGGTGKTPLTLELARQAIASGRRVTILSRGYGGDPREQGPIKNEEGAFLQAHLPDAVVLQGADRVARATEAAEVHHCDLGLMDDGFQHRRLRRDMDIVTLDATNPFGYGYLLPRGLLREAPQALRRAHAIVLTRCELLEEDALEALTRQVDKFSGGKPVIRSVCVPTALIDAQGEVGAGLDELRGRRVALLSGIGNPNAFEGTVTALGARVQWHQTFADHHRYTLQDLRRVEERLGEEDSPWLLTTEKDAVKLRGLEWKREWWALRIGVELSGEIPGWAELLATHRSSVEG